MLSLVEGRTNDDDIYKSFIINLNPMLLEKVILKIFDDYAGVMKTISGGEIVLRMRDLNKVIYRSNFRLMTLLTRTMIL